MSLPAKLTVGSTFGIYPPRGGGQLRILHLYRQLAARLPVDVIALVAGDQPPLERELSPGLREIRVPKSDAHAGAEADLQRSSTVPVTDVAFPELHELTPAFAEALAASAAPGGVLVASHPYALSALRSANVSSPLWYDAHNVEVDLKGAMLPSSEVGRRLLAATRAVEEACCDQAALVLASCVEDAERLRAVYRVPAERMILVPNGVNSGAIRFTAPTERRELRARLRIEQPLALFVGSWHEPNVIAVRRIVELAPQLREVRFAIVGSVGIPFRDVALPANIELHGVVSDELKEALLTVATVALNPVSEGSGTNMKMLDYLAAGIPVVSTEVGVRGLELHGELSIAPLSGFAQAVRLILQEPVNVADERARRVRRRIEERYDWTAIATHLILAAGAHEVSASHSALASSATIA